MATPDEILRLAERHPCFSGCYLPGHEVRCLVSANAPPEPAVEVQCADCLTFRLGAVTSLLDSGTTHYQLARDLTGHLRTQRGYALSFSGYHTQGGGFWLSAAYWEKSGVFLLKSDRGSGAQKSSDVELLVRAFSSGVAKPPDAGMLDVRAYASQRLFVDIVDVVGAGPPPSAQALLAAPGVSQSAKTGFVEVTVVEYLPVSRAAASRGSQPPVPAKRRALALGERCEVCGERAEERALLTTVYVGCRCG